jgi:hypothetical protein
LSGPGFGGWKNRRHSQASANGISGNTSATPMKIMMKKYGCGFTKSLIKFARNACLPSLYFTRGKDGKEIWQFR